MTTTTQSAPFPEATAPVESGSLEARLVALEKAEADLREQMLASSELIKMLADQNAQLIKHIEAYHAQLRWLTVAAMTSGAASLISLALVLTA